MKIKDIITAKSVASALACDMAEVGETVLPLELYEKFHDVKSYFVFHTRGYSEFEMNLSCDAMFRDIWRRLTDVNLGFFPAKFALYAGHDTSMTSFLSCLNAKNITSFPPFAANLIIELYDDDMIYLKYNDEPLMTQDCPGNCTMTTFLDVLQSRFVHNLDEE